MQELASIEPVFGDQQVGGRTTYDEVRSSWPRTAAKAANPPLTDESAAILVGPGKVVMVLLGWHLMLGLAFMAGWMLG